MAKNTTDIGERMAVLQRSLDALCAYVSETRAVVDGAIVESGSEPGRVSAYACSCVGGTDEHEHIPVSETGSACLQYVALHPEKFPDDVVAKAKDLRTSTHVKVPASASAPPAAKADAPTSKPTTAELRAAVLAARADASNLTSTKAHGLKASVKKQMAAGFGIKPSAVGWMDWAIRTKGA